MRQSESRYDFLSVVLHWLAVIIIVSQFVTGWLMQSAVLGSTKQDLYFIEVTH